MKKALLIVVIILAVLLALPVISLLRWTFQAKKPIGIVIVDKTVPSLDREKHKSFSWIMTNNRYVNKETNSSYSYRKNYYGIHPTRPLREKKWDNVRYNMEEAINILPENNEAVYFTDTYGVTFSDWYPAINPPRRTRKLEGALNDMDNYLIQEMKTKNRLILLEYNTFDWPTGEFASFRLQERIGIRWGGWTGRYFESLDTLAKIKAPIPLWMTQMYRKQHKKQWTFKNPGIVLLKDKSILVLEQGDMLTNAVPLINTDSTWVAKWGIAPTVTFDQWFDIIDPQQNTVISKFELRTTPQADTLLSTYGLANEFPAVVMDPEMKRTFYFSGDFCHTNIPYWTARFNGVEKLKGFLYSSKNPEDLRRFFWVYYRPLIEGIFGDYYTEINNK
ncbi:MAG: hypothetical protein MUE74_06075 [Bacteroidales bacterium]|jgi:hypothetical protein|nr:hypothetical protein [Bacteroidales bacterium]